jgi:hypothetical protein
MIISAVKIQRITYVSRDPLWVTDKGASIVVARTIVGVAVEPPPTDKTGLLGIDCSRQTQTQHQNNRNQTNQFAAHGGPPSKIGFFRARRQQSTTHPT